MSMGMLTEDIDFIMAEMFKRVGVQFTPSFIAQEDWYLKHEWTQEQQDSYKKWLISWMKKKFHFSKGQAEREASWILLHCGWKLKEETTDAD